MSAADAEVVMFDFYGTVVDMQRGLTEAITPFLRDRGYTGRPEQVVTWWRRAHFESSMIDALLHRSHTPYREVGRRAVAHVLERAGVPCSREDSQQLVAAIERLDPFPDVLAALGDLRARYRLAVLSNGDRDMLDRGLAHLGFRFDHVISVADAGSFKPHVDTYRHAAAVVGVPPERILFVANHAFDCIGAKAFGMQTAFVDRRSRPFGETDYNPDLIVTDFADLAARLTSPSTAKPS
ncbi:MAG: haloacid dehalogenase type II [Acidimicrobiales bacterium]